MSDLGWPPLPPDLLPADRDAALLSADLVDGAAALFGSGDYADVKFVVEGEPVPAHRLVLCLRSPYFRRLFAARATSAGLREVTVSSASGAAFRALLRYLYTGALDASALTRPQLLELFGHAGLYEVPGLREACERALATMLALDDALELLAAPPTRRRRRRTRRRRARGAPLADGVVATAEAVVARELERAVTTDGFRALEASARAAVLRRRCATPLHLAASLGGRRMRCAASSPPRGPPTPPPRRSTSTALAAMTAASADGRPSRSPSIVDTGPQRRRCSRTAPS